MSAGGNDQNLKISWLSKSEVFSSLTAEDLSVLASLSETVNQPSGSFVFREKDPGDSLYILMQGSISIFRQTDNGETNIIAELIPGDSFGELEFLTVKSRNASAQATKESSVVKFPSEKKDYLALAERHPDVSAKLLHSFIRMISRRIRSSNLLLKENSLWVQELKNQVYGDKLTGLYNKTYLEEELPLLTRNREYPVSLLLMKPDNFKYINDTFGHDAGDESLKLMAASLKREIGSDGSALKYMGNELGVILPGKDKSSAYQVAERIRTMFNSLDITSLTGGTTVTITVSIGIAAFPEHGGDAETIISKAHELPLVGRGRGGNLILYPEDTSS